MRLSRREVLRAGLGGAALLHVPAFLRRAEASPDGPNVLWIMTDQQRADAVGIYGNPRIETPNLDRLARDGTRFTQFYVASFPCSPSRACMLTGLYAHTHRVVANRLTLDDKIPTLGDVFKREGYRCGWIGKWHLWGQPMTETQPKHGFTDAWYGMPHHAEYLKAHGLTRPQWQPDKDRPYYQQEPWAYPPIPEEHFGETVMTDEAIRFLKQYAGKESFCLGVSYFGPHPPVTPPKRWAEKYDRSRVPLPANMQDELEGKPRLQRESNRWVLHRWSEADFREAIARYYGYVSYIDFCIGRLLEALAASGQAEETLVVFTSDHGDMLGSHGFMRKGAWMYDELLRVPCIVRWPGVVKAGAKSEGLASQVDLAPTVYELAGLPAPEMQGHSLAGALRNEPARRREAVFVEIANPHVGIKEVRTERWRHTICYRPRDRDELYDLKADPLEMHNLAGRPETAAVEADLRERIIKWMRDTHDPELAEFRAATGA